ncbi:ribosome recycling factor [Candidatus Daviesbacteria bacterium]|nr:ribosome recycling factor [Candidatus Daviesbacteria bacterium]
MDPNLIAFSEKVQDTLDHLQKELSAIRAGRANPSLLEEIPINAYGTQMKLMEVGTIASPQPSLLTIQVWDAGLTKDVEKAIMSANLGLNPSTEGQTVRVPIPPLTEERRQEFVKVAHTKGEEAKISIRQHRQDQKDEWVKSKNAGEIGEDELFRREKLMQDLVEKANSEVDGEINTKGIDLMQV